MRTGCCDQPSLNVKMSKCQQSSDFYISHTRKRKSLKGWHISPQKQIRCVLCLNEIEKYFVILTQNAKMPSPQFWQILIGNSNRHLYVVFCGGGDFGVQNYMQKAENGGFWLNKFVLLKIARCKIFLHFTLYFSSTKTPLEKSRCKNLTNNWNFSLQTNWISKPTKYPKSAYKYLKTQKQLFSKHISLYLRI